EPIGEDGLILKGSEIVTLVPEIMQNGQWKSVASSTLQFTEIGKLHRNGSTIYAEEPGVMTLTASGFGQETSIEITSEYVPVKAIRPAANGTYAVHGRNANSTSSGDFLDLTLSHGAGNVIVEPSNASYRNQWTIESSDPEIAEYMPSSIVAVLPKKAGTVTLTAISGDPRLTEPVTGTSVITIEYKNPIVDVFVWEEEIQINKNETRELPLAYMGTRDDCEYITEPEVDWNFETSDGGEVEIARSSLGILTGSTNPDEYCMANTKYQITGVAEGTVTVTGIALDQTNELQPITFRVVVGEGAEETPVDSLQTARDGIKDAQNYLLNNMGSGYTYGYEWEVLSLTRSGKSVETANYLSSVETKYTSRLEEFGLDTKPTTMARVAVALGTIGEDASDFRGIDFIDMICNTDRITEGGNEPMWALIALDSRDYPVPEGAKWTREKLVSEILSKYQNTQTGAFGLNDNVSTSIDMTAMALQALAPYVDQRKDVADAVDKALEYLKSEMNRDAGYGGTVESAAQVLTALTALDIDAADVETGFAKSVARNLITNIMSFKVEDGEGFKHQADDKTAQNMSSIQALYSLESYRRFVENENAFFDLTDVNMRGLLQSKIDDAESLTEDDYTEESWNALQSVLEEAKAVVGDSSSTDEELKNAADAVAAAIAALEAAKSEGGSVAPEVKTITVKFRLVGDTKHEAAEDHNGYVNWIKTFNVTIPEDGTVYDAFVAALDKKGMDFEEGQHSYISSIKAPAAAGGYWLGEYDNGPYSGWKYIVNGEYPNVGLRYYWLEDGDSIVWRYVDDYTDREDATDVGFGGSQ
ncbi:MAG: DUF4430 domain-containing protein, partial [Firmicutes bacterium]|nr:DUF4430 domain-containing protein [Bacillota bacterium]